MRTLWPEAFHTPPPSRQTIYRLRNKFDKTGSVNNAPKCGRPKTSTTEENKTDRCEECYNVGGGHFEHLRD